jgi:hypothetical protein
MRWRSVMSSAWRSGATFSLLLSSRASSASLSWLQPPTRCACGGSSSGAPSPAPQLLRVRLTDVRRLGVLELLADDDGAERVRGALLPPLLLPAPSSGAYTAGIDTVRAKARRPPSSGCGCDVVRRKRRGAESEGLSGVSSPASAPSGVGVVACRRALSARVVGMPGGCGKCGAVWCVL